MRKIGSVALILNEKTAIIKASEPLILGIEVLIYTEIPLSDEVKSKSGLNGVTMPKGKMKIIMLQENGVYLASIVTKSTAVSSSENQALARNLSLYNSIFGKNTQEASIAQDEAAEYSAKLDKTESINAKFTNLVKVGDAVSFQQQSNP